MMLEYFYRWLVFKSSSPNDKYHKAWGMVEFYLLSKPQDPFSLRALHSAVIVHNSDSARSLEELIIRFMSEDWCMRLDKGTYIFIDEEDMNPLEYNIKVRCSFDGIGILKYYE